MSSFTSEKFYYNPTKTLIRSMPTNGFDADTTPAPSNKRSAVSLLAPNPLVDRGLVYVSQADESAVGQLQIAISTRHSSGGGMDKCSVYVDHRHNAGVRVGTHPGVSVGSGAGLDASHAAKQVRTVWAQASVNTANNLSNAIACLSDASDTRYTGLYYRLLCLSQALAHGFSTAAPLQTAQVWPQADGDVIAMVAVIQSCGYGGPGFTLLNANNTTLQLDDVALGALSVASLVHCGVTATNNIDLGLGFSCFETHNIYVYGGGVRPVAAAPTYVGVMTALRWVAAVTGDYDGLSDAISFFVSQVRFVPASITCLSTSVQTRFAAIAANTNMARLRVYYLFAKSRAEGARHPEMDAAVQALSQRLRTADLNFAAPEEDPLPNTPAAVVSVWKAMVQSDSFDLFMARLSTSEQMALLTAVRDVDPTSAARGGVYCVAEADIAAANPARINPQNVAAGVVYNWNGVSNISVPACGVDVQATLPCASGVALLVSRLKTGASLRGADGKLLSSGITFTPVSGVFIKRLYGAAACMRSVADATFDALGLSLQGYRASVGDYDTGNTELDRVLSAHETVVGSLDPTEVYTLIQHECADKLSFGEIFNAYAAELPIYSVVFSDQSLRCFSPQISTLLVGHDECQSGGLFNIKDDVFDTFTRGDVDPWCGVKLDKLNPEDVFGAVSVLCQHRGVAIEHGQLIERKDTFTGTIIAHTQVSELSGARFVDGAESLGLAPAIWWWAAPKLGRLICTGSMRSVAPAVCVENSVRVFSSDENTLTYAALRVGHGLPVSSQAAGGYKFAVRRGRDTLTLGANDPMYVRQRATVEFAITGGYVGKSLSVCANTISSFNPLTQAAPTAYTAITVDWFKTRWKNGFARIPKCLRNGALRPTDARKNSDQKGVDNASSQSKSAGGSGANSDDTSET